MTGLADSSVGDAAEGVAGRLAGVRQRMARAAERVGRAADDVLLVCVTKTRSIDEILVALSAGAVALGENYAQEMVKKREALAGRGEPQWHFIGHLQRNKARLIVPFCDLIHSLDSLALAQELSWRAERLGRTVPVLIEVNCAGEESKSGVAPSAVEGLVRAVVGLPGLELRGMMTMPPYSPDPEASRPFFRQLRQIRDDLVSAGVPAAAMGELSMGMTQDFEVAIEEGATIVRVGTGVFGPRPV